MRQISARWLQITRIGGIVLFLFATLAFAACSTRDIGLHFGRCWFISITNATIQVGRNENRFTIGWADMDRGFYLQEAWNPDWAMAWRPFHAKDTPWGGGRPGWHMLVFPLWPLMPIGAAIAAYAHGVLVGMKRARTTDCQNCGYDLRKTPIVDGKRKCPECGSATAIATAPPLPDAA